MCVGPHRPAMPTRYLLGGLRVESAVPLPAPLASSAGPVDVVVRVTPLGDLGSQSWTHVRRRFKATPGCALYESEDGSRFLVEDGRTISVEVFPGVDVDALAQGLLQPVMAMLLHQRKLLALHASAVQAPSGAVAFLGASGAGKSTLASWLLSQGFGFVADDVCPVTVASEPMVLGGFVWQKLSIDRAATAGGRRTNPIPIVADPRGRVRVRVRTDPAAAQILARAYVLDPSNPSLHGGQTPTMTRLPRAAAVNALVEHTYRRQYLAGLGALPFNLLACARVAQTVPVFRVQFVRDRCGVEELGGAVLRHMAAEPGR